MSTYASETTPTAPTTTVEPVPAPVEPAPAAPPAEAETPAPDEPAPLEGDEDWAHDWLLFKGDKLGIRVPKLQAMSGLAMLMDGATITEQNRYSKRFLTRHLSEASFERVFDRLTNPDEAEYEVGVLGELVQALLKAGYAEAGNTAETGGNDAEG